MIVHFNVKLKPEVICPIMEEIVIKR